jgi:AraC family transcriptional regulator
MHNALTMSDRLRLEPRYDRGAELLIAGLAETNLQRIPGLWERFGPYIGTLPSQVGTVAYGVCPNATDDTYIAGVEVASTGDLPAELTTLRIAAANYAVFTHRAHISTIRATYEAIFTQWRPHHDILDAPFFERYGDDFDPQTGTGSVEIWMPIP